eukprot:TRINITY_DN110795_c0_g1_i1.p1 TRINITY_DN110795_c0_g1~~TRINITY_DN110795_c0_g1_i1.p1  ORF type:complete len:980 (-),score=65.73 TRINITY_DN110795_c0_g1_i1:160-3099(-)
MRCAYYVWFLLSSCCVADSLFAAGAENSTSSGNSAFAGDALLILLRSALAREVETLVQTACGETSAFPQYQLQQQVFRLEVRLQRFFPADVFAQPDLHSPRTVDFQCPEAPPGSRKAEQSTSLLRVFAACVVAVAFWIFVFKSGGGVPTWVLTCGCSLLSSSSSSAGRGDSDDLEDSSKSGGGRPSSFPKTVIAVSQIHGYFAVVAGVYLITTHAGDFLGTAMEPADDLQSCLFGVSIGYRLVSLILCFNQTSLAAWCDRLRQLAACLVLGLTLQHRPFACVGAAIGLLVEFPSLLLNVIAMQSSQKSMQSAALPKFALVAGEALRFAALGSMLLLRGLPLALYAEMVWRGWLHEHNVPALGVWHLAMVLNGASFVGSLWQFLRDWARTFQSTAVCEGVEGGPVPGLQLLPYDVTLEPPGALALGKNVLKVLLSSASFLIPRCFLGRVSSVPPMLLVIALICAAGLVSRKLFGGVSADKTADHYRPQRLRACLSGACLVAIMVSVATAELQSVNFGVAMALSFGVCRVDLPSLQHFPRTRSVRKICYAWMWLAALHIWPPLRSPLEFAGLASTVKDGAILAIVLVVFFQACFARCQSSSERPAEMLSADERPVLGWAAFWAMTAWLSVRIIALSKLESDDDVWRTAFGWDDFSSLTSAVHVVSYPLIGLLWQQALVELAVSTHVDAALFCSCLGMGTVGAYLQLGSGIFLMPEILALSSCLGQAHGLLAEMQDHVYAHGARWTAADQQFVRAQWLADTGRAVLGMVLWHLLSQPLEVFVSWILPRGLRVMAFEAPIDDLGGRLDAGVCLFLRSTGSDEPGYVVCNVGHLPTADLNDVRSTVRASLDCMEELGGYRPSLSHSGSDAAPGFVANILCVLPEQGRGVSCGGMNWASLREVNLSLWATDDAAADWYRSSRAHGDIMRQHRQGALRTFGNLLLSLEPKRLQYQRRCQSCSAVSEGRESDVCTTCSAKTFAMPVF